MKSFYEMNGISQEVAKSLDAQLCDCKKECKSGMLSGSMYACITHAVLDTLDNWTPRLTYAIRCEILDWFQNEYGLCL